TRSYGDWSSDVCSSDLEINRVRAVKIGVRFADVVLTDTNGGILRAGAVRNIVFCPREPIVSGDGYARRTDRSARRVWHVDSSVRGYLHVAVNAAGALTRIEDRDSRAESYTIVVAA